MSVDRLDFLVEGPSMEAALRAMLPSWLGGIDFEVFAYQGKEDLLSSLPSRLRGYSRFIPETWRVIILIDRDDQDCKSLKDELETIAENAGLITRSTSTNGKYTVANRIVIEELEAWYFGDWNAVLEAYPRIDRKWPGKAAYRTPDAITGGTWEAFQRVAQKAGYFKGGLRKVEAARQIGSHFDPTRNTSGSYQAFRTVINELIAEK